MSKEMERVIAALMDCKGRVLPDDLIYQLAGLLTEYDKDHEVINDLKKSLESVTFTHVSTIYDPKSLTSSPVYEFDIKTCSYGSSTFVQWLQDWTG